MIDNDKNKRWSTYWEQGHITTFGAAAPDNYSTGVKAFWFNHFSRLNNGAVILDSATGNGAIAIFAVEYSESHSKDFTVLASDAAVISETVIKESTSLNKYRDKIQFFSSTPCEHLPFDDASIDLVCSQFGIEYSNLHESIPEVSRVLRDNGKFAAIMHHYLSAIVLDTAREQCMLKEALFEYNIFDLLKQYSEHIGETTDKVRLQMARKKPETVNCEKIIRETITNLRKKYPGNNLIEMLWNNINNFATMHIGKPKAEQQFVLEKILNSFQATIDRQSDLLTAAKSKEAMKILQNLAIKKGFKNLTYEKNMNSSFGINGWNVTADK